MVLLLYIGEYCTQIGRSSSSACPGLFELICISSGIGVGVGSSLVSEVLLKLLMFIIFPPLFLVERDDGSVGEAHKQRDQP